MESSVKKKTKCVCEWHDQTWINQNDESHSIGTFTLWCCLFWASNTKRQEAKKHKWNNMNPTRKLRTLFSIHIVMCCNYSQQQQQQKIHQNAQRRQSNNNFITFGNRGVHVVKCHFFVSFFLWVASVHKLLLLVLAIAIEWRREKNAELLWMKWQRRIFHSIDFDFVDATLNMPLVPDLLAMELISVLVCCFFFLLFLSRLNSAHAHTYIYAFASSLRTAMQLCMRWIERNTPFSLCF